MNSANLLAISAHDHKLAAICCDKVYPLFSRGSVPKSVRDMPTPKLSRQNPLIAFAEQLSTSNRYKFSGDADPFMNYISWLQSEPTLCPSRRNAKLSSARRQPAEP